jgi:predicted amidohydrolase YtcJ
MIARRFLSLLLPVLTLSCALSPSAPPLPTTARTIAVLPPNNRTGDPLLVESASFLHPYADRPGRVAVPDVLATEVREQLAQRGITVMAPEAVSAAIGRQTPGSLEEAADLAAQGKLEGSVLYIEIRRWEADMSPLHPQRIIVALEARLLDPATGRTVWVTQRPLHPVPTPGVATRWRAYMIAARKVAEELFTP